MRKIIPAVLILSAAIFCGCSTVKGAAGGFVQDVRRAGKGIKTACVKIMDIPSVKNMDKKFREIAW